MTERLGDFDGARDASPGPGKASKPTSTCSRKHKRSPASDEVARSRDSATPSAADAPSSLVARRPRSWKPSLPPPLKTVPLTPAYYANMPSPPCSALSMDYGVTYDPDFGVKVCERYTLRLALQRQGQAWRTQKYGEAVAAAFPCGHTPEVAREVYELAQAELTRRYEEGLAESDSECDGESHARSILDTSHGLGSLRSPMAGAQQDARVCRVSEHITGHIEALDPLGPDASPVSRKRRRKAAENDLSRS